MDSLSRSQITPPRRICGWKGEFREGDLDHGWVRAPDLTLTMSRSALPGTFPLSIDFSALASEGNGWRFPGEDATRVPWFPGHSDGEHAGRASRRNYWWMNLSKGSVWPPVPPSGMAMALFLSMT